MIINMDDIRYIEESSLVPSITKTIPNNIHENITVYPNFSLYVFTLSLYILNSRLIEAEPCFSVDLSYYFYAQTQQYIDWPELEEKIRQHHMRFYYEIQTCVQI